MKNGFLLVDKESGYTSRDVCNIIAKIFNANKVGHAGTLDPFATGLLIVGINNATKALSYIEGQYKTYEATLLLGQKTTSGDHTDEIIEGINLLIYGSGDAEDYIKRKSENNNHIIFRGRVSNEEILNVFQSLIGHIEQTVPITSAVHVNGRKLYQYAHLNQEVELPKRTIEIKELELISFSKKEITFVTTVSKGTYIRVLGETIAERLGTVGHLTSLRRTKILDIDVNNATKVKELKEENLLPIADIVKEFLPTVTLSIPSEIKKARHGGKLSLKLFKERLDTFGVLDPQNHLIAIYKYSELGYYECNRGIDNEDY